MALLPAQVRELSELGHTLLVERSAGVLAAAAPEAYAEAGATLSGADLVEMTCTNQNFEAVAAFAPGYQSGLVFGSTALEVMQKAHEEH